MTPGISHFKVGEAFTIALNQLGLEWFCINICLSKNRTHMSVLAIHNNSSHVQTLEFEEYKDTVFNRVNITKNGTKFL